MVVENLEHGRKEGRGGGKKTLCERIIIRGDVVRLSVVVVFMGELTYALTCFSLSPCGGSPDQFDRMFPRGKGTPGIPPSQTSSIFCWEAPNNIQAPSPQWHPPTTRTIRNSHPQTWGRFGGVAQCWWQGQRPINIELGGKLYNLFSSLLFP